MTKERALEIERFVIYRNRGYFEALSLEADKMFEIGIIFERLHNDLKKELEKEIEKSTKQ